MPTSRPTGLHHGDLRNALLGAALELVAERGAQGFTLAETSRRAGVSVAAPYKHFADKDALLAELARTGYERQHDLFQAAMSAESDPADQLAAFAAAYVAFAAENKALFEITFAAGLEKQRYPALAEAGDRVLRLLRGPAAQLTPEIAAQDDLIHTIGAAAHGFAAFLAEGIFGEPTAALAATQRRARDAARKLALAH
ncbi:TetR/AcrR family transcriptional regulator [Asanoa ishikariensis]|nr:TetR/AcrR family transcriptional regulator [Asanoa ishikariensis]